MDEGAKISAAIVNKNWVNKLIIDDNVNELIFWI